MCGAIGVASGSIAKYCCPRRHPHHASGCASWRLALIFAVVDVIGNTARLSVDAQIGWRLWVGMDEEDVDYRELLQKQTPEQRNIQRLEWRWARRLPRWERATLKVQACYR